MVYFNINAKVGERVLEIELLANEMEVLQKLGYVLQGSRHIGDPLGGDTEYELLDVLDHFNEVEFYAEDIEDVAYFAINERKKRQHDLYIVKAEDLQYTIDKLVKTYGDLKIEMANPLY